MENAAPAPAEDKVDLQELLNPRSKISSPRTFGHILWLRRWAILVVWLVLGVPGAVFLTFYDIPHTYWATAYLRFPNVVGTDNPMARDAGLTETQSIVRLFLSRNVMSRTIRNMKLQFNVTTKNVFRRDVFTDLEYDDSARVGRYTFRFQPKRRAQVFYSSFSSKDRHRIFDGPVTADGWLPLPGLRLAVNPKVFLAGGDLEIEAVFLPEKVVYEDFKERLGVGSLDGDYRMRVNYAVSLQSRDPTLVADVLNDLVRNFIATFTGTSAGQDLTVLDQMEKSLQAAREKERRAQQKLAWVYSSNPTLREAPPTEALPLLLNAQAEKRQFDDRLENARELEARKPPADAPDDRKIAWISDAVFLLNSFGVLQVNSIQARMAQIETRRGELTATLPPTHPRVLALDGEILGLLPELEGILASARKTWTQRSEQAASQIARNTPRTASVTADLEARRLEQEKENAARAVEALQRDYDRARMATGNEAFKITVVDEALPPEQKGPSLVRRLTFAGAPLAFGLFAGVLGVIGLQVFFSRIFTRDDAERKLRLKVLGSVFFQPVYAGGPVAPLPPPAPAAAPEPGNGEVAAESKSAPAQLGKGEPRLLHWGRASTLLQIENYRLVRSQIKSYFPQNGSLAFMVTSSKPGEGKSLFAANIAMSFARNGRRTLLVDGDMRHGRLDSVLDVDSPSGLMELLETPGLGEETRKQLSACLVSTPEKNLYFLPKGSDYSLAGESANKEKVKSLMALLRKAFDVLVVDAPPVIVAADALSLMEALPNVVFLVRSGFTAASEAQECLDLMVNRNARVGCVVNAVQPSPCVRNHFAKYGYYYAAGPRPTPA